VTVGFRLIYDWAFGGVTSMSPEMFRKVNGYSLQFFGWGGEDDDMGTRYDNTDHTLILQVANPNPTLTLTQSERLFVAFLRLGWRGR